MSKTLFVTVADYKYFEQAKQLFSGLYFAGEWTGDCAVLTTGMDERQMQWFISRGILVFTKPPFFNQNIWNLYQEQMISNVATLKFYLFGEDFKKWDLIVYSDLDIIIQGSLKSLNFFQGSFMAVQTHGSFLKHELFRGKRTEKFIIAYKNFISHFDINKFAFNSGFFAFRPNILNNNFSPQRIRDLHRKYSVLSHLGDQFLLNLIFHQKWYKLPCTYNIPINLLRQRFGFLLPFLKARILHVWGEDKPWLQGNPFFKEWEHNLHRSDKVQFPSPYINSNQRNSATRFYFTAFIFKICVFYFKVKNLFLYDKYFNFEL